MAEHELSDRWAVSHDLHGGLTQTLVVCLTIEALAAVVAALMSKDVSGPPKLIIERTKVNEYGETA